MTWIACEMNEVMAINLVCIVVQPVVSMLVHDVPMCAHGPMCSAYYGLCLRKILCGLVDSTWQE
jgi:putative component of membrane protein insertase Oxa1/YidC/SpoIIIJ protein YidD